MNRPPLNLARSIRSPLQPILPGNSKHSHGPAKDTLDSVLFVTAPEIHSVRAEGRAFKYRFQSVLFTKSQAEEAR